MSSVSLEPAGYLATDVSPPGFHSSNFAVEDQGVLKAVYKSLDSIRRELHMAWAGNLCPLLNITDTGQIGILEKLIAMRSANFLAAPDECGDTSSFNKEIVEWRMRRNLPVKRWHVVEE